MPLDRLITVIQVAYGIHWIQMEHTIDFETMIDNQYSLRDQQQLNWMHFFWKFMIFLGSF